MLKIAYFTGKVCVIVSYMIFQPKQRSVTEFYYKRRHTAHVYRPFDFYEALSSRKAGIDRM